MLNASSKEDNTVFREWLKNLVARVALRPVLDECKPLTRIEQLTEITTRGEYNLRTKMRESRDMTMPKG